MAHQATKIEAAAALQSLRGFLPYAQLRAFDVGARGEEMQWFFDKAVELAGVVRDMPVTYQQAGKGGAAVAFLHYFRGGADWYITEKDCEREQHQAFGLVDLGHGSELGYISLIELVRHGVELDLHWTPKTLAEIRASREVAA